MNDEQESKTAAPQEAGTNEPLENEKAPKLGSLSF